MTGENRRPPITTPAISQALDRRRFLLPCGRRTLRHWCHRRRADRDVKLGCLVRGGWCRQEIGLDYEVPAKKINPRLVYCFDHRLRPGRPLPPRRRLRLHLQAMAGMMSITGEPGREPQKAGGGHLRPVHRDLFGDPPSRQRCATSTKTREGQHIAGPVRHQISALCNQTSLSRLRQVPLQMGSPY